MSLLLAVVVNSERVVLTEDRMRFRDTMSNLLPLELVPRGVMPTASPRVPRSVYLPTWPESASQRPTDCSEYWSGSFNPSGFSSPRR